MFNTYVPTFLLTMMGGEFRATTRRPTVYVKQRIAEIVAQQNRKPKILKPPRKR